jgi:hypothetical protein
LQLAQYADALAADSPHTKHLASVIFTVSHPNLKDTLVTVNATSVAVTSYSARAAVETVFAVNWHDTE